MRTRYRFYLLVIAGVVAMATGVNAMAAESPETLATSASKPVALGAGPVAVTLAPAPGSAAAAVGAGRNRAPGPQGLPRRKGLGTNEPPEVIYQVILGCRPASLRSLTDFTMWVR